jgi:hypothetical protein
VLVQWVEKARLVQLKGLGVENLRLLERVGIESTFALSKEDPESLYDKIEQAGGERVPPRKAMIRIWVREAREEVTKSEW